MKYEKIDLSHFAPPASNPPSKHIDVDISTTPPLKSIAQAVQVAIDNAYRFPGCKIEVRSGPLTVTTEDNKKFNFGFEIKIENSTDPGWKNPNNLGYELYLQISRLGEPLTVEVIESKRSTDDEAFARQITWPRPPSGEQPEESAKSPDEPIIVGKWEKHCNKLNF